jgi:DNA-binding MarR family transcriptional regulator
MSTTRRPPAAADDDGVRQARADGHQVHGVDVDRLARTLAALTRSTRREVHLPLGASTLSALVTVAEQGPIRLGELARHEGITPATLSRVVTVLDDEGYVARTTDENDRRSAWLEITPAGRRLLAGVRRDRVRALSRRTSRLSPDQARALDDALDALERLAED